MIRIAFVIDTIDSPTAGTEKQLLLLIKHLDKTKFQPYLCVLWSSKWLERNFSECELIDIGCPSYEKLSCYTSIVRFSIWLRKQTIDIVQTHFIEGNKVGILAGKMARTQVIISARRNQGYWHNKIELFILNVLNRYVTCFLANSESTRQWVAKVEGITLPRIEVIHNGLEIEQFHNGIESQRIMLREQLAFPHDSIIVGIVANLRPVKAIDIFIKAAKLVSERSPQARFIIIGDGTEKASLETLCKELGLVTLVRFMGKRNDIPEILSCMDIGVLTSNSESFSSSIVEYMAAGLPVVCTDVGGAREAVDQGINGYLVPVGDYSELASMVSTIIENNMKGMGSASRGISKQRYSMASMVGKSEFLYSNLVKAGR